MHACATYYHQGSDLCSDLEPFFKKLADEVTRFTKRLMHLTYVYVFSSRYQR